MEIVLRVFIIISQMFFIGYGIYNIIKRITNISFILGISLVAMNVPLLFMNIVLLIRGL